MRHFAAPSWGALFLPAFIVIAFQASDARAEGEKEREIGWSSSAELSLVATAGNAEAETLGFHGSLLRRWDRTDLRIETGGLRAETTTLTRSAVGASPDSFALLEDSQSELTAENYHLDGRWDRLLSERRFWYLGAGWMRNRFAGINSRSYLSAGGGKLWHDSERSLFRTTYGLTYTWEDEVIENPRLNDSFPGARLSWEYWRQLTATARYGNDLILDANLNETSDYRADMINWLSVSMSDRLALRVSLQFLYANQPALEPLPLVTENGEPTGEVVFAEYDNLDSILTVGLQVRF